jgi:hypothetical protein
LDIVITIWNHLEPIYIFPFFFCDHSPSENVLIKKSFPIVSSKNKKMKKSKLLAVGVLAASLFFTNFISAQGWWRSIKGEGPVVTRNLNLAEFDAIYLQGSGNVFLKQGATQSVTVEGQENIIDNLKTNVSDKTWKIGFEKSVRNYEKLNIYITIPALREAHISGSGNIRTETGFTGVKDLGLSISGSGNVSMDVEAATVNSRISGSGNISLKGSANSLSTQISGSGDVHAYDLSVKSVNIRISGSGDCEVNAAENLEVSISGSGGVTYMGRPKVNAKTSGSGRVRSKE